MPLNNIENLLLDHHDYFGAPIAIDEFQENEEEAEIIVEEDEEATPKRKRRRSKVNKNYQ